MITVTILTKNSARSLKRTLESTILFPEVLILDTGSSDETLSIAKQFSNVKIHETFFEGFGPLHNKASSLAHHPWILSLDSDEILTPDLVDEIQKIDLQDNYTYSISRHNYFNDKWIKGCGGWHPDRVVRLYNKNKTSFSSDTVHERIITTHLKIQDLKHPILHTPYLEISDFLNKMQLYSDLFAQQHKKSKKSSLFKAIIHSWIAFIKSYFLKKGFLDGKEGFIISIYNAHTTFYKYLKISMP